MKITIIKRNGKETQFNPNKITVAVQKATKQSNETINADFTDKVVEKLEKMGEKLAVETVQDVVEETLMECGFKKTAREYIKYRNWRTEQREIQNKQDKYITDVIELSNLENENANMNEKLFTAKKERVAGEVLKQYALKYLISPEVRKAYEDNLVYIHDLNSYSLGLHNCLLVDLGDVLKGGFKTQGGAVREPNSISSAMQLVAVVIQCTSNEMFGGCAISALDSALAPYVEPSFQKWVQKGLAMPGVDVNIPDDLTIENAKQYLEYPIVAWAYEQLEKEIEQSAEALYHNLNTLTSRAANQLPFSSLNAGLDTSEAGRMITKACLKARMRGIGPNFETCVFPIGVFQYNEEINGKPGAPNYDLFQLAIESASKRIYPNFVNTSAPHLKKPTNKNEFLACMGCRTTNSTDRHGLESLDGRGNISPVTMNLTKVALLHKQPFNEEKFFEELDSVINVAIKTLLERYEWQAKQKAMSASFIYENQVLKGPKLKPEDEVREVLKHNSLSLGYLGLSNALVALIGEHHAESEKALQLGLKIVEHIHNRAKEASDKYDLNFGCYATPAESLCHKMAKANQKEFGIIPGVTDKSYVNNSHHVPVYANVSLKEKIDIEAQFAKYATAGNITYVELDGNARNNLEALEALVKYAMEKGITYFALNHKLDSCRICNYEGIIGEECPKCGAKDEGTNICRLRRVNLWPHFVETQSRNIVQIAGNCLEH